MRQCLCQVKEAPEPPTKVDSKAVTKEIGPSTVGYTLHRINDDESTTAISDHDSIVEGMTAAAQIIEVDHDFAYTLLSSNGSKVATFCEGRIGYISGLVGATNTSQHRRQARPRHR